MHDQAGQLWPDVALRLDQPMTVAVGGDRLHPFCKTCRLRQINAVSLHVDDKGTAANSVGQLLDSTDEADLAIPEQRNAVADGLHDIQHVGRQQDGHAFAA